MFLRSYARRVYDFLERRIYYYKNKNKIQLAPAAYNKLTRFSKEYRAITTCEFNNHTIKFSSPFWFLHSLDEIFVEEVYKYESEKNNPIVIDCGANIGLSVLYFKKLHPNAKIIAFEPDPGVFEQLRSNIHRYNYHDIDLVNAAVWDKQGSINFNSEGSVGGKINLQDKTFESTIDVPTIRLRDYLTNRVDFLKIDIEGVEYDVLKDCADLLQNVGNLFIEYHVLPNEQQTLHVILQWVHEAGFKYYIREAWNNMTHPYLKIYNDYYQMQLNIFCYR